MTISDIASRRGFLRGSLTMLVAASAPRRALAALSRMAQPSPHPTPRPGITGAKVLSASELSAKPGLIPLFDAVRAAPGIIDGIRCHCGCANEPGNYSLLTCFEAPAMALSCVICQGQGRLATRLYAEGKSLDEIRAAVDAKFD